jgi:hypothetical protein
MGDGSEIGSCLIISSSKSARSSKITIVFHPIVLPKNNSKFRTKIAPKTQQNPQKFISQKFVAAYLE